MKLEEIKKLTEEAEWWDCYGWENNYDKVLVALYSAIDLIEKLKKY